jgi:isopenicillin N synthase-like dioxygenase
MNVDDLLRAAHPPEMAVEVEHALMTDGYLVLRGDRLACIGAAMARWEAFAALPMDVRRRYHQSVRDGDRRGGWTLMRDHAVYSSHMSRAELESAEPKQEYGFGVETETTLWPDDVVAPGFAASAREATAFLDDLSRALLAVFEAVLGEEAGFLRYESGYVALKHHPAAPPGARAGEDAGLDEHSDAVVFTLFSQSIPALQVKGRDGQWHDAPADPSGCLVVGPGDWMELFTNGHIPALRHRVLETQASRMSLAFFQNVAPMPVGPLAKFLGDGEGARYPTVASDIDYVGGESGVPRWQTAENNAHGQQV